MERLASVRIVSPMAPWCSVNLFPCSGTLPQRIALKRLFFTFLRFYKPL
jgi:hypothetical protein